MTLHRTDLLPRFGAGYRGARPGVIVAALERVLLESMLSIGFNAQARLLQARQGASAAGWSAAEEAAQRAAKAIASLSQSTTRLLKAYSGDQRFDDDRQYGEIVTEPRLDMLAERALTATDPTGIEAERESLEGRAAYLDHVGETLHFNAVENYAYLQETVERLRRYEPEWLTLDQHKDARRAAEDAAAAARHPEAPRAPDAPRQPDRDRVIQAAQRASWSKSEKQVMAHGASQTTTSCGAAAPDEPARAAPSDPPARRGRGATGGNSRALKNGHHTASMREQLAEDRKMSRQVLELCAEADRVSAGIAGDRPKSDFGAADSP